MDRKSFRKQLRELRREIPNAYRQQASLRIAQQVAELDPWAKARTVAGFLPFDGEIDPLPLMDRALMEGRRVYVPIIVQKGQPLKFAPWTRQSKLQPNRSGILEPAVAVEELVDGSELDLVLVPLVGFDAEGNRIGVGGGFYDRTFAFRNGSPSGQSAGDEVTQRSESSPALIGIAFETQRVESIQAEPWDVRLDWVVTEAAVYPSAPQR